MAGNEVVEESAEAPALGKRVSWTELFFDLVFVVAITQVAGLLHHDHSSGGIARDLVLFIPVYWVWIGTSVHANIHDVDRVADRLGVFGIALCALFMALATPMAFERRGLMFAAAYYVARLILVALIFRGRAMTIGPFSVAVLISGPLLLAGAFTHGSVRLAVWAAAAATDLLTPRLTRRRLLGQRFDAGHLPERFGLLVIIALGESIVSIGLPVASETTFNVARVSAVSVAFALACGLWWVYFHFAASAMRHSLIIAREATDIVRQVLSYGHLLFLAGVIALAAGLSEVVEHPTGELRTDAAALLVVGTAVYLAGFGYTRWRMFRLVSRTRLTAAVVVLALLPVALVVPALVALSLITVVVAALNGYELAVVRRQVARRA